MVNISSKTRIFWKMTKSRLIKGMHLNIRLRLISNQFVQPLFKTNQFFFEFSKLTSLIHSKNGDPNYFKFTAGVAVSKGDLNHFSPPKGSPFQKATVALKKYKTLISQNPLTARIELVKKTEEWRNRSEQNGPKKWRSL